MRLKLVGWGLAALIVGTLAGCGGGSGGGGTTAAGGAAPAGGGAAVAVAPPTGPVVNAATLTSDQFAALAPTGAVTSVAINSPPVVTFQVTNAAGNGVAGLGFTSKGSTALLPGLSNMAFSLAKLVPGTNGSPSKWVSYIVTKSPTTTAGLVPDRPTTDNIGTLVDNGDGTYQYTFYRDIAKVKDLVAAATLTAPSVAADLGDLTYDPSLLHRLVIQIGGNARGTGTNTADGSNSGVTSVPMGSPVNLVFDWYPATGEWVDPAKDTDPEHREVVAISNCNECHGKLAFHGGNRVDTKFCVVCHTDQRKFGYANVASTSGKFPALTETATPNATTGIIRYTYKPDTRVADGEVVGDFPIMVHKIHQGKELVKENYNYANVAFNNKGYSMLGGGQKMCTKCHDNTQAVNADNWKTKPSRKACGACHDGIKWSDGTGMTLADKAAGGTTLSGHAGKAQSSDATCALCHGAADIATYHQTENITKHNPTIEAGLKTFTYEIKSAAVNSTTNDVTVVFKISADGTALTALPPTGFTGGPSFLLAWAQSQDGITTPVDYNNLGKKQAQAVSVSLANLLKNTGGSVAGPDATGYFTATLTGANQFPVGAKMRAVALNGYFTQTSPAAARHAISVVKEVTGDTVRRKVVDPDKCSNCHEWFEGHGGNRVYQTQVCVLCHVPGMATSGRGISDAALAAYTFSAADNKLLTEWGFDKTLVNAALQFPVTTNNFKDMIHGIHAGRERVTPFVDARDRTPSAITLLDFRRMDFPGRLNNCQTCHVAGTYSSVPVGALSSTYESIDAAYAAAIAAGTATTAIAKTALSSASTTDTVASPFAAACGSCHDSAAALGHMATNNGLIQVTRGTFQTSVTTPGQGEACATCHGTGKAEDVAVVHK